MKKRFEVVINHIALQAADAKKAQKFFTEVLKMKRTGAFKIDAGLSDEIFGIKKAAEVIKFTSCSAAVEVFILGSKPPRSFAHVCIEVGDREELMKRCKKAGVASKIIDRNGKKLLFIRDFTGNIFEIKDAQKR